MPGMLKKTKKIEPRVSDATRNRMRFVTGQSLASARGSKVQLMIGGEAYEVVFDESGRGTAIKLGDSKPR